MTSFHRRLAGAGLVAAAAATGACSSFLEVENPSAVQVENLADSSNATLLLNGVIGQFQAMVSTTALWGGLLADESRATHVNVSYAPIDLRTVTAGNDIIAGTIYPPIQRLRYAGDTVADRLKGYAGANAGRDLRVARALAMGGYGYIYLAETFCSAPINGGANQTPQELFTLALPRFDEAIAIVTAARAGGTLSATQSASADSILNLARVGAARAALNLNDKERARGYAAAVPASFEYRAYYAEGNPPTPGLPTNPYYGAMGSPTATTSTTGNTSAGFSYASGGIFVAVDSAFVLVNDPRVPKTQRRITTMNGTSQFVANKPKSFGGYIAPSTTLPGGTAMTPGASIRVASGLEAQYIVAEANNGSAATLAFVNAQRTANAQGASTAATPEAVLADLRDQKRREFYLDGHRLGEIRRYKRQNNLDFFPTGPAFGTVECFPIPTTETNANPKATS